MEILVHNYNRKLPVTKKTIVNFVISVAQKIELELYHCQIIFTDDETLRKMHQDYLDDPNYTDIITFNLGDTRIEGEIYISYDRAVENAKKYNVTVKNEIYRILIHGLLHLKGYDDIENTDRTIMKQKENELLNDMTAYEF